MSVMTALALLLLPLSLNGQGSKSNFSGSWVYNAEKSTQVEGQRGGRGGGDFTVVQDGNTLTVERTMTGRDGQAMTTTAKYTLDGKESVSSSGMGDAKSTATWSADGKTLTIKTSRTMGREGQTRTMTTTEVWKLTDASTLSIESTMPGRDGDQTMTRVYNKK